MEQTPTVEAPAAGAGSVLPAAFDAARSGTSEGAPTPSASPAVAGQAPVSAVAGQAPVPAVTGPVAAPAVVVRAVVSLLAGVEPQGVCEGERVEAIAALEELKGAASAAQARLTAAVVSDREGLGEDTTSIRAEVALARRCSPSVADRHVGVAKALTEEMPHTLAALASGVIGEWRAQILVRETACLTREDRGEVDTRLAGKVATLGDKALAAAARRIAAELDAQSLATRHARAVASRRVSVRPAPDGMAWLSILGPLPEIVGAHTTLLAQEKRRHVIDEGLDGLAWEAAAAAAARADTRGKGAWMSDRALELLSGRAKAQPQPVAVDLVMTDRTLLPAVFGGQAPADDVATIPGWGVLPGQDARDRVRRNVTCPVPGADTAHAHDNRDRDGAGMGSEGFVWLRRLFTDPTGRNLVALDSTRRRFQGGLARFLQLRDPTCRIPWCDAPATQADHATPAHQGGATSAANGDGLCQRHNLVKEHPGWHLRVTDTGLTGTGGHTLTITTPTGHAFDSTAPPILGEGWTPCGGTHAGRSRFQGNSPPGLEQVDTSGDPPEPDPADAWFIDELPPLPDDPSAGIAIPHYWVPDPSWFTDVGLAAA